MKTTSKLLIVFVIALFVFIMSIMILVGMNNTFNIENYYIETYTVESGDTLWELGTKYCNENDDVRVWIDEVEELNDCSADLDIGQKLKLYITK